MGKFLTPIIIILLATLHACNSAGCLDNGSAIPLAGFYSSETGKQVSLNVLQIEGFDSPNDSVLLYPGKGASEVYLPMRSDRNKTKWALSYAQDGLENKHDSLVFEYESIPYFASVECGAMYYYKVTRLDYSTNLIDSVVLVNEIITNADIESIRIYFKTQEAEEGEAE